MTIRLAAGDVSAIRVSLGPRGARLAVYQRGETGPLIQASLTKEEVWRLRRTLLDPR